MSVGAGGRSVGGPTTVAGDTISQVWSWLLLSVSTGHQMALACLPTAQGWLIFDTVCMCVWVTVCVCVCVCVCVLSYAIVQWQKRYASNHNKLSYFDPRNIAVYFLCVFVGCMNIKTLLLPWDTET